MIIFNSDLLSIFFSYLIDEHIFCALVCKKWKNIIKNRYNQINTSYNAINSIEKLLYFCVSIWKKKESTDNYYLSGWYNSYISEDDDLVEIYGNRLSNIIVYNLTKNNNNFLLYFDSKKVEMYDDKCFCTDGYILNFPKIIEHLFETEKIELLTLICDEHCSIVFPQSIIEIVCDPEHEDEWEYDIIEKIIWKCLRKYGYNNLDLPEDHYVIRKMKSYANCSICFGLDETCCW